MKMTQTYDWPTRLFHWSFAFFFTSSFVIAKYVDSESAVYAYHMLSGLMMATAVVLRLVWAVVGSRYARFDSFDFHPRSLALYFKHLFTAKTAVHAGHNPASSWSAVIMMVLALAMAITGSLMALGIEKPTIEDYHELLSTVFVIVVLLHIAGVLYHSLRHRDRLALSMVDGYKNLPESFGAISSSHSRVGLTFVALMLTAGVYLWTHYDSATGVLHVGSWEMALGEEQE